MWTIVAIEAASGKEVGRAELTDQPITVGRGKDCGLTLPSGAVSRKHARLEMRGGQPYVVDEGSANGTMVNGAKISGAIGLDSGMVVDITPFKLMIQGPPDDDDEEEKTVMLGRGSQMPPPRPPMAPPPPARPAAPPPPARPAAAPPPPRPAPPPPRPAPPAPPAASPSLGNISLSTKPPPPPAWQGPTAAPPPKPPPKPAVEEPKFLDIPSGGVGGGANPSAPKPGDDDWDSAASELDRQIQSVRSYREQSADVTQTRVMQLDADWARLVTNLKTVKQRLSGNPRLLVFNFSRGEDEVTIKIEDKRQRLGYRYFLISRSHPENKFPGQDSVWLRETGREDMDFKDAKAAQSELLQRIAATLA